MKFEPVRFSAALSLFGTAVISLLALLFAWAAPVVVAVSAVWTAAVAVFNSFIVRGAVTPTASLGTPD